MRQYTYFFKRIRQLMQLALTVILVVWPYAARPHASPPPPLNSEGLVIVTVDLLINKIYHVDTIDETFALDGYMRLTWKDMRAVVQIPAGLGSISYFNKDLIEHMGSNVWWPVPEFINIIGDKDIPNAELTIHRNGDIIYYERFNGVFSSEMDFRKYPFDSQHFEIRMESFSYDNVTFRFQAGSIHTNFNEDPEWKFGEPSANVTPHPYDGFFPEPYSAYQFIIKADRRYEYFIWQFFFPLILLVTSSWIVFFIDDFGEQLSTAFTLLLTVVAFNFYVSTLLPRLPYNTFIEITIISAYATIFAVILIVVFHDSLLKQGRRAVAARVLSTSRWLLPAGNVTGIYLIKLDFLG